MGIFDRLFGKTETHDIASLLREGAQVIDVRTREEFRAGHARGSINIPLNELKGIPRQVKDPKKPLIVCCASGMRSGTAAGILRSKGMPTVINAGSWTAVRNALDK